MSKYVMDLLEVGPDQVALVGGKAASLGELSRLDGISVPGGFCVTTEAFRLVLGSMEPTLERLSHLTSDHQKEIRDLGAELRKGIAEAAIPGVVEAPILRAIERRGGRASFAVRSSATGEDQLDASFAGQHDSFLNLNEPTSILRHVLKCWASLFTDRALRYRLRNDLDRADLNMAVVVQEMAFPQKSGILFTADPLTSDRHSSSVEACLGLGEALVSGLTNPDIFKVRDGVVVSRAVATKEFAIEPSSTAGTSRRVVEAERRDKPALTDGQLVELEGLGRRIESHLGRPQDIEWCLVDGGFQIVQSRPITSLFPLPGSTGEDPHVYVSVGHQQMMTDAMKPLGLSLWQMTTPRPMTEAGNRLFVDVTTALASPSTREFILGELGRSDPLIGDALRSAIDRGDPAPAAPQAVLRNTSTDVTPADDSPEPLRSDPAIITRLIERSESSVATLVRDIPSRQGSDLLDFIRDDVDELKRILFDPESMKIIMATMEATWWLNERMYEWLGEKSAADVVALSVPGNVSAEMGLALLDVADAIRPHPELVAFLESVDDDSFLDRLDACDGGMEAAEAIRHYLRRYGMRCIGEIDITRPRWSDNPAALLPMILQNVRHARPGAAEARFEEGRRAAEGKVKELLERVRELPDGLRKAEETSWRIDLVRTFTGYREYPKYGMVNRYFVYREALLHEADRLVSEGAIGDRDDIYFLRFDELQETVRTGTADQNLILRRRREYESSQALVPPRVITSDGRAFNGSYDREDLPSGALAGLAVSAGTVEGRARVVLDVAEATVRPGDILVTTYTDPSWAPLFVGVDGLITEVGGLMTHGAVVAREYGLPAVVGVENATKLITDGQQIRVNGTDGYVELLD